MCICIYVYRYICMCVSTHTCMFISRSLMSFCQSVAFCLFVGLFVRSFVRLFVCLFVCYCRSHPSVWSRPSVWASVRPSVCPSVSVSLCLFPSLSLSFSLAFRSMYLCNKEPQEQPANPEASSQEQQAQRFLFRKSKPGGNQTRGPLGPAPLGV